MQTQKTPSLHQRYTHSLSSSATTTTTTTTTAGVVVVVVVPHIPLDADTEDIVTTPAIHAQFE